MSLGPPATVPMIVLPDGGTPARTHEYRLFVYDEKAQTVGPAKSISAGNDAEPIAQAEAIHGLLCAELLDLRREDQCEAARVRPGIMAALR